MVISAREAYRRWSPHYDRAPNPLLALEQRVLSSRLQFASEERVLDAGCGTGRWMKRIPNAIGLDRSAEMIQHAVGHRVIGDAGRQPFANNSFDIALCSFTLSYLPIEALGELARIARIVVVSDLHPEAGWKRGFRVENESWEIEHNNHSLEQLDRAAEQLRLKRIWRVEAHLDEPEREIFRMAGREWAFAEATQVPAIAITAWTRSSD